MAEKPLCQTDLGILHASAEANACRAISKDTKNLLVGRPAVGETTCPSCGGKFVVTATNGSITTVFHPAGQA